MSLFGGGAGKGDFLKNLKDKQEKKGKKKDKDTIPYYDLDENDPKKNTMRIRLLPIAPGVAEPWVEYSKHEMNKKSIRCSWESSGESCDLCQASYEAYQAGDKDAQKQYRSKEVFLAQAIVIESPVEVPMSEDGNLVKKIYLPFKMKEVIQEAILNQQIEDPSECDFVIKKTKNQGGYAAYDKSYFDLRATEIPDAVLESMQTGKVELFDLRNEVPKPTTSAEIKAFIEGSTPTPAPTPAADQPDANAPSDQPAAPSPEEPAAPTQEPAQSGSAEQPAAPVQGKQDLMAMLASRRQSS